MYLLQLCLLLSSVARSYSLVCTYCSTEAYSYSELYQEAISCNESSLQCPDGFLCSTSYVADFEDYGVIYFMDRSCMPQKSCNVNGSYSIMLAEHINVITCCNTTDYCTPEIPAESFLTKEEPKPNYNGIICPMCDEIHESQSCARKDYIYNKCRGKEHNCFHMEYTYVSGSRNYTASQRGCATDGICTLNTGHIAYQAAIFQHNLTQSYSCTSDSEKSVAFSITLTITLLTALYHLILQ
ncbi:uncharacterized protein [Hyperolius riggenbachi]